MSELVWDSVISGRYDIHVLLVNFNGLDPVDIRLSSSDPSILTHGERV